MITMTADERVRRGYDISEAAKQARIDQDLAYWRTKAPVGGTARSQFDAVLANYEGRRIDRSDALVAIRAIEAGRSPTPRSVRRPGATPAASSPVMPLSASGSPSAAQGPDVVESIVHSAGYRSQASDSEADKVAIILQHHREVTGLGGRQDEAEMEAEKIVSAHRAYKESLGRPGASPKFPLREAKSEEDRIAAQIVGNYLGISTGNQDDGLTAAERHQVEQILANYFEVTGIKSRSQTAQDKADQEVVDRAFARVGYPAGSEHPDPKVKEILAHHRAVIGR